MLIALLCLTAKPPTAYNRVCLNGYSVCGDILPRDKLSFRQSEFYDCNRKKPCAFSDFLI